MSAGRPTGFRPAATCRWLTLGVLLQVLPARAVEWTQYRGPTHDGVSAERINKNWTGSITNPVWRVQLTNGLTSLTVSGGRVFTQVRRTVNGQSKDVCLALSGTNGTTLWFTVVDDASYPNGGVGSDDGPRSTPVLDGSSVFLLTSYHKLYRINAINGAVIWTTNLVAGFGGAVIQWQSAASPLIENGLIFINANCAVGSLMAFSTTNGTLVWRSQNEGMTHSTPVLATINGVRQVIFATQSGLVSLNPQSGALLWRFSHPFSYEISIGASPAVCENLVFLAANYSMGAYAVQIVQSNATQVPAQLWADPYLKAHWATPVCLQGTVIGPFEPDDDTAELRCIDLQTGQQRWAVGDFGRGGTMLIGTNLLMITERGDLVLAEANTNQYVELQRFTAIPGFNGFNNKCWNALALSDGQLYVRSTAYAARFDLSAPDLKLDTPKPGPAGKLSLTVRAATGTPLDSNRLTNMSILASTNLALSRDVWTKLTNAPVLTNGTASITNVDAPPPRRYFIVSEPR